MLLIHATAVVYQKCAVLLRGPSGAGKSDLAIRLIDGGALLVADDQVHLARDGDFCLASPPATLAGLLEIRGVGIVRVPHVALARVTLVCDLMARANHAATEAERVPLPRVHYLAGVPVPAIALHAFSASAPAVIRLLLSGVACLDPTRLPVTST